MTPVERLEAAIEKLERQWRESEPVRADSGWVVDYDVTEDTRRILILDSHNGGFDGSVVAEASSEALAQLMVTLHRTIDAQLAILRSALHHFTEWGDKGPTSINEFHANDLALADAILGGDQ